MHPLQGHKLWVGGHQKGLYTFAFRFFDSLAKQTSAKCNTKWPSKSSALQPHLRL